MRRHQHRGTERAGGIGVQAGDVPVGVGHAARAVGQARGDVVGHVGAVVRHADQQRRGAAVQGVGLHVSMLTRCVVPAIAAKFHSEAPAPLDRARKPRGLPRIFLRDALHRTPAPWPGSRRRRDVRSHAPSGATRRDRARTRERSFAVRRRAPQPAAWPRPWRAQAARRASAPAPRPRSGGWRRWPAGRRA